MVADAADHADRISRVVGILTALFPLAFDFLSIDSSGKIRQGWTDLKSPSEAAGVNALANIGISAFVVIPRTNLAA